VHAYDLFLFLKDLAYYSLVVFLELLNTTVVGLSRTFILVLFL
jgi:hypothetical protein